jgi:hypothetical protein
MGSTIFSLRDLANWPPAPIVPLRPEEALVDVTPREITERMEGKLGSAVCPFCETVVAREQAVVSGPVLSPDERYDFRPVFAHSCKQAMGVIHLYADLS